MKIEIPTINLEEQYRSIQPEIDSAVLSALASGQFILGPQVSAFEREFAEYCDVDYAVGVSSGTTAIQLALLACNIGPGDEVITVSHTAVATIAAIELTGASPVLVDINPGRYTLEPARLANALTPRTRAIVPVHLYGCPAELEPIMAFANQNHLFVIEDCCQAHGAQYRGKPVGGWGHLAAFSFYPTKNLGAYGDAGAVLTNDPLLAKQIRSLRQYGWGDETRTSQQKGLNARIDELQATILRVKLQHLEAWNDRRRELAAMYKTLLSGTGLTLPIEPPETRHVYHQFVIRHREREALRVFLAAHGIMTQVHYPVAVHLQPAYRSLGLEPGALPVTEAISNEILSLPIYPEMKPGDVKIVCDCICLFHDQKK